MNLFMPALYSRQATSQLGLLCYFSQPPSLVFYYCLLLPSLPPLLLASYAFPRLLLLLRHPIPTSRTAYSFPLITSSSYFLILFPPLLLKPTPPVPPVPPTYPISSFPLLPLAPLLNLRNVES